MNAKQNTLKAIEYLRKAREYNKGSTPYLAMIEMAHCYRNFARKERREARFRHHIDSIAYLVGFIDRRTLKLVRIGCYSESAATLTYTAGLVPVEMFSYRASSYHEAAEGVYRLLASISQYEWLRDAILLEQVEASHEIVRAFSNMDQDTYLAMSIRWSKRHQYTRKVSNGN